jgi:hypothetical protein
MHRRYESPRIKNGGQDIFTDASPVERGVFIPVFNPVPVMPLAMVLSESLESIFIDVAAKVDGRSAPRSANVLRFRVRDPFSGGR